MHHFLEHCALCAIEEKGLVEHGTATCHHAVRVLNYQSGSVDQRGAPAHNRQENKERCCNQLRSGLVTGQWSRDLEMMGGESEEGPRAQLRD
jgi:hypothetical protein